MKHLGSVYSGWHWVQARLPLEVLLWLLGLAVLADRKSVV